MDQHHDSRHYTDTHSHTTSHRHHEEHHSSSHTVPRPRSPTPDSSPPFQPLTRVSAHIERHPRRCPAPCPIFPPCASSSRPTRPDPSWWNREAAGIPMSQRPRPQATTIIGTGRAPAAPNTSARRRGINRDREQDHPQQHALSANPNAPTSRTPSWGTPGTLMHEISLAAQTHRAAVAEAVHLDKLEREERERLRLQQYRQQNQGQHQRRCRGAADGNDEEGEVEGLSNAVRKLWRCVKGNYGPASWREEERRRKWMEKGKGVAVAEDGNDEGEGEFVDVWEEKWLFDNRDTVYGEVR